METAAALPRWRERIGTIRSPVQAIDFPRVDSGGMSQDEEWCEVTVNEQRLRLRFHDYGELYKIPGLYERLFYVRLKCCSPSRVVQLLVDVMEEQRQDPTSLRVLDLGAGNGMVGDELNRYDVESIVGVDILPEAKSAALRDRPGIYDDYFVSDLSSRDNGGLSTLRARDYNCLTTVAALGFADIPPKAFLTALRMIASPGWIAFNIKEDFLRERDDSGFSTTVRHLMRKDVLQVQAYRRYRHRVSITGSPLHYIAMVAKKLKQVPDDLPGDAKGALN